MIQLIPLHIELNKVLRLKTLLKELELQIGTLPMNWKNTADDLESIIKFKNTNSEEVNSDAYTLTLS